MGLGSISITFIELEVDIVDFVEWWEHNTWLACKDESKDVVFTMG